MRIVIALLVTAALANAGPTAKSTKAPAKELDCAKLARSLFKNLPKPNDVACGAGRFGAPGTFVWARGRTNAEYTAYYGAVRNDGTTLVKPAAVDPSSIEDPPPTFEVADLDGDGVDELIATYTTERHATGTRAAVAYLSHDKTFTEIEGPRISWDNSNYGKDTICTGAMTREPDGKKQRLVVTVDHLTGPPENCLAVGRHVFELHGGKLVEIKRP